MLSIAVIASATFILISVDAFRRDGVADTRDPHSGTGGYPLMVESLLPVVHDPNTRDGRQALNLVDLDASVTFEPFRVLPGDDTSCLNLYEPRKPRILGVRATASLRRGASRFRARWPPPRRSAPTRGCCWSAPRRTAPCP